MTRMMLLFVSFLISYFLFEVVVSDSVRWTVPYVNERRCNKRLCVITQPFHYDPDARTAYLDLSRYIFLGDVNITNKFVKFILPPQKPVKAPAHRVTISTSITYETARRLRKIFFDNDERILGVEECTVTNFLPPECHHVIGDMYIDKKFILPKQGQWVETVSGCLHIEDTDFSILDMDFLNGFVPDNRICGKTKRMLIQRIVGNKNFCSSDLFPSLDGLTVERHCGNKRVPLPEWYFHMMFYFFVTLVCLSFNVPPIMYLTTTFAGRYWIKNVEPEMETCNEYIMNVRNRKKKSESISNILKYHGTKESGKLESPVSANQDRNRVFEHSMKLRNFVRILLVLLSCLIVLVMLVSALGFSLVF